MSLSLPACIETGAFARISDIDALHLFAATFTDELNHLKNASPTVESSKSPVSPEVVWTPSQIIYGEDFTEVNRTLVSMLAVKWLLADEYETFVHGQPAHNQLSRNSFDRLRRFVLAKTTSADDAYAILVALAIDDIGKDPHLTRSLEEEFAVHVQDHSEAVLYAAIAGSVSSLNSLPSEKQFAVLQNLEIGSRLNISQMVQAETAPASLTVLRNTASGNDSQEEGFDIKVIVTILDVAGAAGHRDPRGCVVMTESVFEPYMGTITLLDEFRKSSISTPRDCYHRILSLRADMLHRKGFDLLSPEQEEQRALLRLFCMGRVISEEKARLYQHALGGLDDKRRVDLVSGLNVDGIDDGVAILPYYAPGILAEALRNTLDQSDASVVRVLTAFMEFLARVFDGSKPQPGTPGGIIERDLSFALETVQSISYKEDPSILGRLELKWKKDEQHDTM
ncbi:hypothetical protein FE257_009352 [Aspergillus nanangensis]|uniref:Uncharacterized protein n=1 Tax=Aspergillus nanangensis TaxID=2582783 RepID=A0AAD4GSW6_ASPNN|nr:hypothetical protein FE257_009352 [Aspergillus nanangensis]